MPSAEAVQVTWRYVDPAPAQQRAWEWLWQRILQPVDHAPQEEPQASASPEVVHSAVDMKDRGKNDEAREAGISRAQTDAVVISDSQLGNGHYDDTASTSENQ